MLYHLQAIIESGPFGIEYFDTKKARELGAELAKSLKCETIEELRKIPAEVWEDSTPYQTHNCNLRVCIPYRGKGGSPATYMEY